MRANIGYGQLIQRAKNLSYLRLLITPYVSSNIFSRAQVVLSGYSGFWNIAESDVKHQISNSKHTARQIFHLAFQHFDIERTPHEGYWYLRVCFIVLLILQYKTMSECHYTSLYVTITMKIWRKKYLNKNKSWFNTTPKIIHGSKTVCFGKVNICLAVCFEFEIWCLTSLSAIFQLYHGDQL
jgi:hypothetical protein